MTVEFRNVTKEDYGRLSEILDDEWKFHLYSDRYGLKLAEYYLMECMNGADLALSILLDGEVQGILILKDMGEASIDTEAEIDALSEELMNVPKKESFLEDLHILHDAYDRFAKQYKTDEFAELSLVILDKKCRGTGAGRRSIEEAMRLVSLHGKKGVFFYTDTDCNFGFYDHLGAVRLCSEWITCFGEPLQFFGYSLENR